MIPFLLAAQLASAQPCLTVQPSPAFVCVNGGWLPPGHPNIPKPPEPSPTDVPFGRKFRVGKVYERGTTRVFIAGVGQLADGNPVVFALCQAVGDGCFAVDYVRIIPAAATSQDWVESEPAPGIAPVEASTP